MYEPVFVTGKNGNSYTLAAISFKAAKAARLGTMKGEDFNDAFLIESLRAGGHANPEQILDEVGFFIDVTLLREAALKANGFEIKKGEPEPEAPAAV